MAILYAVILETTIAHLTMKIIGIVSIKHKKRHVGASSCIILNVIHPPLFQLRHNMKHKQTIKTLLPFVKTVSGKSGEKAVRDMSRAIAGALAESEVDIHTYQNDYKDNKIFDASCLLINHAKIFDFVKDGYLEFCKVMFALRPIGMGTPNAAVGEGEFMALFCSPDVQIAKKKDTGDLIVNGKSVELKGSGIRIFGDVTGIELQQHANKISKKYGISPNESSKDRTAFEPWYKNQGGKKVAHWKNQFSRLGVDKSCDYLNELCSFFMTCTSGEFLYCFSDGVFDVLAMERFILKKLFASMPKKWNVFTQIDNGVIKCLTADSNAFNEMVESATIKVTANYFRSFQNEKIGLYVKINGDTW